MNKYKFEAIHADTCLPDYWGGHHLPTLQIIPEPGMSLNDIKAALYSEANEGAYSGASDYSWEQRESDSFHAAIVEAIGAIEPADAKQKTFFNDVEQPTADECGDFVYAFFVFRESE